MREFILLARKAVTEPFRLNDLPGAGRMDLVTRCISNAIFISEAIRKDVIIYVVLNGPPEPPKTISFDTRYLRRVSPDERNIASHINISLSKGIGLDLEESIKTEPGIVISKVSFERLVREKLEDGYQLIYLTQKGSDIRKFNFSRKVCFVLGDHRGIPKVTEKFLKKLGVIKLNVGPLEYLSSQCITIVHNILDVFESS